MTATALPSGGPRRSGRRLARMLAVGAAVVLVLLTLLTALAWLNRRAAAREVLVGWLDRRGIEAEVEVERLELDGFVGRVRIGDADDPDVTIERVEVDYALAAPWSRTGLGVTPSRIRLVRPVARATWADGRLSFGSLDPLIEEFTGRPPRPDSRGPVVVVETGRLRLATDYGPVSLLADARVDDGKLMRLSARMPAASLRSGAIEARGLGGRLELTTTGDRAAVRLAMQADRLAAEGAEGEATTLILTGDLPYPDLEARRGDGRATLDLTLTGRTLALGALKAADATLNLTADGAASGWIETLAFNGATTGRLRAAELDQAGLTLRAVDAALTGGRVSVRRRDAATDWSAAGPLTVRIDRGRMDDLTMSGLAGRFDLDAASGRAETVRLAGSLAAAGGGWPLFGSVSRDDLPELAEMKRALGAFSLSAPGLRLTSGSAGTSLDLTRPARITPTNGGALVLSAGRAPLFSARPGERGGGAVELTTVRGRGLPGARVSVPDWGLTAGGFRARLDGRATLDFGLARGLTATTSGLLASDRGRLTYAPSGCVALAVERLELDENDVTDVSGRLCSSGGPLLVSQAGRWRVSGRMAQVDATAPFLALNFTDAEGAIGVAGDAGGLGLTAQVASALVEDATRPRRFNPLTASGEARLAGERWTGGFDLARNGVVLGRLGLNHDGTTGAGGVTIDAPAIVFSEDGLQPADLSPLAADFVRSPATGSASFSGRIDWSPALPEGGSSSGRLAIPNLDFSSPAGPVRGLSGTIDFTNLAPLTTAPNQTLRIAALTSIAPLTDLDVTFQLDKAAITVSGAAIRAAGGIVRVEPFSVPLDDRPFSGVIVLERVQLGELIAGSGFGDRVRLDAIVSGRLPFTSDPATGVRITGGTLHADQPGRLSIPREALSGLQAGGGGDVPPGTVEDLAYQAMENLAFDVLTADVDSADGGRLGVRFHIVGRHDPPQHQELRLSLAELISREFLNRPLTLPSDTGIDLTLDTTLNLNQLVSDLLAVNRARNGGAGRP